jgi:iron complex outermembrane receptor protein
MWNWRVTPAVSLTNALRVDHLSLGRSGTMPPEYPFKNSDWDRSTTQFSFNSGVVWTVTPADTARLIVSRGVQLPNLVELGALLIDTPYLHVTGLPMLKPTAVTNFELAWDHNLPEIGAHLQINAFHQVTANIITIAGNIFVTPHDFFATSSNAGSSNANGAELSAKGALGDAWRWSVSYRAEFVDDDFLPFAVGGLEYVDYEHTTPKHLIKANLGWASGKWEADTYLYYQSNTSGLRATTTGTALVPIGAYISLDGRIAYRLTDWATLAVSGQNLLQSPQRQTSGPAVERRVFATVSASY